MIFGISRRTDRPNLMQTAQSWGGSFLSEVKNISGEKFHSLFERVVFKSHTAVTFVLSVRAFKLRKVKSDRGVAFHLVSG